jgi:hypothetical protein
MRGVRLLGKDGVEKLKMKERIRSVPTLGVKPALRRCGLCGKTGRLTKTECCGRWICDDESEYVLFSFARNSCHRNHRSYTLCGFHHANEHRDGWKECSVCRKEFETEMYVYYGTNEHNFEVLENPPDFAPTRCTKCNAVINLGNDGYSLFRGEYSCSSCSDENLQGLLKGTGSEPNSALQRSVPRVTSLADRRKGRATRPRR